MLLCSYERKLANERDIGVKAKTDNTVMTKKFNALSKELEDQKEEIRGLHDKQKELHATIMNLEKEALSLKKEV